MRVLRITGITILALLVTLVLLAAWLLNSASGSRAVLSAARGWLPPGLSVAQVSGAIAGTLRITQLHYRDEAAGLDLRIDQAELEFSPAALLARRLKVKRAALDGVRLESLAGKPAASPAATRSACLPGPASAYFTPPGSDRKAGGRSAGVGVAAGHGLAAAKPLRVAVVRVGAAADSGWNLVVVAHWSGWKFPSGGFRDRNFKSERRNAESASATTRVQHSANRARRRRDAWD